jgi:hypothetical protein
VLITITSALVTGLYLLLGRVVQRRTQAWQRPDR